ncbi:MAG: flagellar basal body rod protein FlgC [Oscillospiraceae bacterium]|nr:flagellar basal body rod protein FlgC [Oscillospiraceae bacterium]
MAFLSSLNIAGSGLTAQRFRMDVISQNIANSETTTTEIGEAYIKKSVVMKEKTGSSFSDVLGSTSASSKVGRGVEISDVEEDSTAFKLVYDPTNAEADETGYVKYPDIDMVEEMMDLMSATRSYQANITSINAVKAMASSALQIGK